MEEIELFNDRSVFVLAHHTDMATLFHATDADSAESIVNGGEGLLPSSYGDIDIVGNEGANVYACRTLEDALRYAETEPTLRNDVKIIAFKAKDWYEVIDERPVKASGENFVPSHVGCCIVTERVPEENCRLLT